jgi:hypothetical protein
LAGPRLGVVSFVVHFLQPRPDNGSGDSPRPPFLTEFVNQIGKLALVETGLPSPHLRQSLCDWLQWRQVQPNAASSHNLSV